MKSCQTQAALVAAGNGPVSQARRPRNSRPPTRAAILFAVLCAIGADLRAAEAPLASAGDWRVVRIEDPFATPSVHCEIQSTLPGGDTGRREQGRLRIVLPAGQLLVDPSVVLTQAVRLRREILDRRQVLGAEKRTDISASVRHALRVDEGKVYSTEISPPAFDAWDATPIIDDFAAFLASMGSGAVLFHGWRLKPAEANDRYDLKGFAEMLAAARAACPG